MFTIDEVFEKLETEKIRFEIISEIDDALVEHKEMFKEVFLKILKRYVDNKHYEHTYDECQYDFSGTLMTDNSNIDLEETVEEYLNEYTGSWTATYMSHYGKRYNIIQDDIEPELEELFYKIAREVLNIYIENNIGEYIDNNDDLWWFAGDYICELETDMNYYIDFTDPRSFAEHLGILHKKVSEIIKN